MHKKISTVIVALVGLSAVAQTNQTTLRINIPAAVEVTQVRVTGVTQPAADARSIALADPLRQNLAGRIGVDAWVETQAAITIAVTRNEMANLLGVPAASVDASVPVGAPLPIPQSWVPALLKKVSIAMNPYACQRYTNGIVRAPMLLKRPATAR